MKAIVTKKGNLKGYCTVWYHLNCIANILPLINIQKKYKVSPKTGAHAWASRKTYGEENNGQKHWKLA